MEAEGELLTDLAVVVGDHVAGVRVDAGDPGDLDEDAGLLLNLADDGLADRLAQVLSATGQRPEPIVRSTDEQQPALVVPDDGADRDDERVGLRCARVVEVVGLAHAFRRWLGGRRVRPDGVEARSVRAEQVVLACAAEVDGGGVRSDLAVDVRADQRLICSPGPRVCG